MSLAKAPKALLNLQKTTVLVADADIMGQNIIVQILIGFGARNIVRCDDLEEVKRHLTVTSFELIIIDPSSFGPQGYVQAVAAYVAARVASATAQISQQ